MGDERGMLQQLEKQSQDNEGWRDFLKDLHPHSVKAIFKTRNGESGNRGIGESGNRGIGESGNRGIFKMGNL